MPEGGREQLPAVAQREALHLPWSLTGRPALCRQSATAKALPGQAPRTSQGGGLEDAATVNGHAGPASRGKHVSMQQRSEMTQGGASRAEESLAGKQIRLSDPEGFLMSNDIISDVFCGS